jgi:hypothetical protein
MSLSDRVHVEGLMNMYPYGASMGAEQWFSNHSSASPSQYITLFQGEDYGDYKVGFGWFGSKLAKGIGKVISAPVKIVGKVPVVGSVVKTADKFASNAVKISGKAIGTVTKPVQSAAGVVGKGIGKIPVVGSPLHTVFDASFHTMMAPANLTIAIASGQRIDNAVLNTLKNQLHDFKQVAPYAQMVISLVPGVGQGVSACLSAGLALAEGQSIEDVIKAGMIGALPGGPLVKAAVTMGVETIQHVAKGERLDLQTLSKTATGIATSALGLPIAASNALVAGVAIMGNIASGKPLDKALTDNAIAALPVSTSVKTAMTDASALAIDLSKGKKIDAATTARINAIAANLPATNPLHDTIKTGLDASRKAGTGKAEQIMATALQSGLGDSLVSMGAQPLPADVQKGIKAGVGVGSGSVFQAQRKNQLPKVVGKLKESGIQLAKTSPMFAEARKLAATKGATHGFDVGSGLLEQQVGTFDVATVRNSLDATQKLGFDMATAARIGAVANPKPEALSPAAHAGNAITLGMQTYQPEKNAVIMQTIQSNPSATVGAKVAVNTVIAKREHWLQRVLKALHLQKAA